MSAAEETLAFQLRAVGIVFVREVVFAPPRKWRADFLIGDGALLVEVDGGTWTSGRHVTGSGYAADIEKANEAILLGFRVLRVTPAMVDSGHALALIERALA
ncbi:Restriction_endonuclease_like domain containing protein [uncultured Caudovirales phage]|uniref:Restriction_endonuclease_like domain containing protein n=1 Tax=uncultured Caudovirales phage TaxID=2100421 RepID=A0A6J5PQE0_9CAUD|nr:Restriction_endonuclease_like domain containing protein [uncultured Caudovirales phage]CAB4178898.1 Restriction_endonuclease_like domain containing protein [uncultured Caudovirales phage]CAB4189399.1 Restriction_endonuclease_like domain containing protein [uncultured Caudovirales phage]CAB4192258.1 Restriction_endonuclease_like domain containing protein [uncultured Caudovirales phage]CAB4215770.1 Restriction_endonuclease_like domain containing protein [uncultured Caudovirales phage]